MEAEVEEMQKLYDSDMCLIGYSKVGADGRINVYNSDYKLLGYYVPSSDKTYDSNRKLVGKGNLTADFLGAVSPANS